MSSIEFPASIKFYSIYVEKVVNDNNAKIYYILCKEVQQVYDT